MNISWRDEDSKNKPNEKEDPIDNVVFISYMSTNVCSHMQKKTNYVATETTHCYNNIVLVDNFCNIRKRV